MKEYNISEQIIKEAINKPDSIVEGYNNRKVYQKKLNGYILRVVIEEEKGIKRVITVYKTRSERYGI